MKFTNQVRKQRGIKPASPQVKTRQPSGIEETVTVVFRAADSDKELFKAELPAPLYSAVLRACKKLRKNHSQFFDLALRHYVATINTPLKTAVAS
jgi:hypothetical protein